MNSAANAINHPIPFEDELALGLLARVAKLNGLSVDTALQGVLELPHWPQALTPLERVAWFFGSHPLDFIQRHILPPHGYIQYGRRADWPPGKNYVSFRLKTPAKTLRWCPACAKRDLSEHGQSYWRRSHQLHGLDWCHRHQIPLYETEHALVLHQPHTLSGKSAPAIFSRRLLAELQYPALRRLQNILLTWVRFQPDITFAAWCRATYGFQWQEKIVLRQDEAIPVANISESFRRAFPTSWLERHTQIKLPNHHYPSLVFLNNEIRYQKNIFLEPNLWQAMILAWLFPREGKGILRVAAAVRRHFYEVTGSKVLLTPSSMHLAAQPPYSPGFGVLWSPSELNRPYGSHMRRQFQVCM